MGSNDFAAVQGTENVVSQYCFLVGHSERGGYYLDIYIPEALVTQLQLVPGSSVLVQGLGRGKLPTVYVRARTGLEASRLETMPFTATVRFPNKPHMLQRFLHGAVNVGVQLQAVRTFGYRGEQESDVVIEGSIPAPEPSFVERHNLRNLLNEIASDLNGTITTAETLKFVGTVEGRIMDALYYLDMHLFSGRYLKVRVNPRGLSEPFKSKPPMLHPARVRLDYTTLTLTIDPFTDVYRYLLSFSGRDLGDQPVTKVILDTLPAQVNVDALSAYEYVRFDPDQPDLRTKTKPSGRIEMLCTSGQMLDAEGVQDALRDAVGRTLGSRGIVSFDLTFEDFQEKLDQASRDEADDLEWGLFRKRLHVGRFAYIDRLGSGNFGVVNKYFDLKTRAIVAGKHIPSHKLRHEEIIGLRKESEQHASRHVVRLVDSFYDDDDTVLIMEYVDFTLAAHHDYPSDERRTATHGRPADIAELVEMAVHLCMGLETPHGARDEQGNILIHGDIKPENVGATLVASEVCWKLLDFGLASRMKADARQVTASGIPGTLSYMSPQVFRRIRSPLNDIYALGIMLQEVLAGWRHPSSRPQGGQFQRAAIPVEVEDYLRYLDGHTEREPDGFEIDPGEWHPRFRDGQSDAALEALANVIRRMIRMNLDVRYQSAVEVRLDLETWRGTWL